MQLGQLAALERDEIFKEYNELRGQIRGYEELLSQRENILARDPQGPESSCATSTATTARREIIDAGRASSRIEDLIAEEINAVTISHNGYIKRLPLNTYRTPASRRQGRLGRRHPRRRLHRALLRRLHARLFAVLHRIAASSIGSRSTTFRR